MKHAVIFAHPRKESFTAAVASAYIRAAEARGHLTVLRDLYDIAFDPCLKSGEIPGPGGFEPGADVLAERALLEDVDVFAFVYPLWLNTPPAILKGYWERIFGMGFAYGRKAGASEPLMTGRGMLSFTSSGAPMEWVKTTGAWDAMQTLFDAHIAALCGFRIIEHIHFGSVVPGIREDAVERHLKAVTAAVEAHF